MKLTISGYQNGNICNKKQKKAEKKKTKNSNKNDNGNIKKSFPKLNKKKDKKTKVFSIIYPLHQSLAPPPKSKNKLGVGK